MSAQEPWGDVSEQTRVFLDERRRLFRIAYRIVTDRETADDVVQETWIRWQSVDPRTVQNAAAFLTTTTARLAINVIQSARHRHELLVDLSTPLPAGTRSQRNGKGSAGHWGDAAVEPPTCGDPADQSEQRRRTEQMLGVLMGTLTPAELAAFLLRKCFDYPYEQIARVLTISAANARQLVCRSRIRLAAEPAQPVDRERQQRLVRAFSAAARNGDVDTLESALAAGLTAPSRRAA